MREGVAARLSSRSSDGGIDDAAYLFFGRSYDGLERLTRDGDPSLLIRSLHFFECRRWSFARPTTNSEGRSSPRRTLPSLNRRNPRRSSTVLSLRPGTHRALRNSPPPHATIFGTVRPAHQQAWNPLAINAIHTRPSVLPTALRKLLATFIRAQALDSPSTSLTTAHQHRLRCIRIGDSPTS